LNLLKEAGHVLATVAPTIATAVGGPFAGMAVTALQKALGLTPSDTTAGSQAAIEQALAVATPEQILALKQAENAFTVQMEQLGITKAQLVYQDIANARAREIAVKDSTPRYLAYLVTVGFFGVLGWLLIEGKPAEGGDVMMVMVGSLGTAWTGIVAYYFGSSSGSAAKTDAMTAALAKK
jgi:hypothetical protein